MNYRDTPKVFQHVINQLNKAFSYIRKEIISLNLPSLDSNSWHTYVSVAKDSWILCCSYEKSSEKSIFTHEKFKPLQVIIKTDYPLSHNLFVEIKFFDILKRKIYNYYDINKTLMTLFLTYKKVTPQLLEEKFLPFAKIMSKNEEILNELEGWIYASNYKESLAHATKLEKFLKYLPLECKKSPSNTLYRCLLVDTSLLDKVVGGKKSALVLKNRLYSSWTYDEDAVNFFSNTLVHSYDPRNAHKDRIVVILKRTFDDYQIMLNVLKTSIFLRKEATSLVNQEKEIIVRNIKKDFRFKPKEIYLLRRKDDTFTFNEYQKLFLEREKNK